MAIADWLPLVTEDSGGPLFGDGPDRKTFVDGYEHGWREADAMGVDAAVEILENDDPHAMFVYLGNPDESSHQAGSIGEEYRAAIAEADRQVGRIMDALRSRSGFQDENWLVLSSTDHGRRADGGHGGDSPEENTIYFLAWGSGVVPGPIEPAPRIVDVAATALTHLGVPLNPERSLDGRPEALNER